MPDIDPASCTAFAGNSRIAAGSLADVALAVKAVVDRGDQSPVLIFDDATSQQIEVDLRGTPQDVAARLAGRPPASVASTGQPRRAGRPKLGVVGREVTLLPRHWDWLAEQPGGASVALRRLIDAERKSSEFNNLGRKAQEVTYRFMHAVAGNFSHFEEASRALFAGDRETFVRLTEAWPVDVRDHARWLMTGGAAARDATGNG
ncbi:DUF2239 family protein [Bradyrhizobium sp. LHD-71]|uniref:DUF2239 family protein n=1 Tax=Bradyrhizobium sp. LHD-71 TaxID=3072141 RepID=UPI00280D174A|nr:DUF2239 family protein [Bradyrhizobium sp. LHD-71]MDQ8726466.1 DUF2239 family protein [Bradyrhizobium sp. LHD-71]